MARSLLIGAVALGVVGWLFGLLLTMRPGKRLTPIPRMFLVPAVSLPLVALAGTLGNLSFLSPAAGFGFALGSGGALLAGLVVLQMGRRGAIGEAVRRAGPLFAAIAAISAAILWLPQPLKAAPAAAIGWCAVTLLFIESGATQLEAARVPLFSGLGLAVALSVTTALGVYRTSQQVIPLTWESTAAAFAAGAPLGVLVAGLAIARPRLARRTSAILSYGIPAIVVGALALLLGDRIPRGLMLTVLAGVGLGTAILVSWLNAEAGREGASGLYETASTLVVVGAFAASFSILAGYGVGLMLLAAWPLLTQSSEEDQSGTVTRLAAFGLLLLVYRLFAQRYQSALAAASLTDHFALLGFLVGASLPMLIAAVARTTGSSAGTRLLWVILALLIGSGIPAAMFILWAARIGPALLFGLAFAFAVPGAAPRTRNEAISAGVFTLGLALAMVQWAGFLFPLSELARADRMRIFAWIVGGILVAFLIVQYATRLPANFQKRRPVRTLGGQH